MTLCPWMGGPRAPGHDSRCCASPLPRCVLNDIDRFPDSKSMPAPTRGLVPRLDESADVTLLGRITKKGDKWLRRNMVECARVAVRKDPHLNEFYTRLSHKRGERKALIAVARKLV